MPAHLDPDLGRTARRNQRILALVLIGIPLLFIAAYVALWALNPIKG